MPTKNRKVQPGYKKGTVISEEGELLTPPSEWAFLPAGDGPLTRNVKKRGPSWQVQVKRGRRTISKGIWVKEQHIFAARAEIDAKRATPEYERKREADLGRRELKHREYVEDFYRATLRFLNFHSRHREIAEKFARAVSDHATPVGSGTVARTERIPLEERVQAAVIAWMRHNTTGYDSMRIARIKGRRREVRRMLAQRSKELLANYRQDQPPQEECPLYMAVMR